MSTRVVTTEFYRAARDPVEYASYVRGKLEKSIKDGPLTRTVIHEFFLKEFNACLDDESARIVSVPLEVMIPGLKRFDPNKTEPSPLIDSTLKRKIVFYRDDTFKALTHSVDKLYSLMLDGANYQMAIDYILINKDKDALLRIPLNRGDDDSASGARTMCMRFLRSGVSSVDDGAAGANGSLAKPKAKMSKNLVDYFKKTFPALNQEFKISKKTGQSTLSKADELRWTALRIFMELMVGRSYNGMDHADLWKQIKARISSELEIPLIPDWMLESFFEGEPDIGMDEVGVKHIPHVVNMVQELFMQTSTLADRIVEYSRKPFKPNGEAETIVAMQQALLGPCADMRMRMVIRCLEANGTSNLDQAILLLVNDDGIAQRVVQVLKDALGMEGSKSVKRLVERLLACVSLRYELLKFILSALVKGFPRFSSAEEWQESRRTEELEAMGGMHAVAKANVRAGQDEESLDAYKNFNERKQFDSSGLCFRELTGDGEPLMYMSRDGFYQDEKTDLRIHDAAIRVANQAVLDHIWVNSPAILDRRNSISDATVLRSMLDASIEYVFALHGTNTRLHTLTSLCVAFLWGVKVSYPIASTRYPSLSEYIHLRRRGLPVLDHWRSEMGSTQIRVELNSPGEQPMTGFIDGMMMRGADVYAPRLKSLCLTKSKPMSKDGAKTGDLYTVGDWAKRASLFALDLASCSTRKHVPLLVAESGLSIAQMLALPILLQNALFFLKSIAKNILFRPLEDNIVSVIFAFTGLDTADAVLKGPFADKKGSLNGSVAEGICRMLASLVRVQTWIPSNLATRADKPSPDVFAKNSLRDMQSKTMTARLMSLAWNMPKLRSPDVNQSLESFLRAFFSHNKWPAPDREMLRKIRELVEGDLDSTAFTLESLEGRPSMGINILFMMSKDSATKMQEAILTPSEISDLSATITRADLQDPPAAAATPVAEPPKTGIPDRIDLTMLLDESSKHGTPLPPKETGFALGQRCVPPKKQEEGGKGFVGFLINKAIDAKEAVGELLSRDNSGGSKTADIGYRDYAKLKVYSPARKYAATYLRKFKTGFRSLDIPLTDGEALGELTEGAVETPDDWRSLFFLLTGAVYPASGDAGLLQELKNALGKEPKNLLQCLVHIDGEEDTYAGVMEIAGKMLAVVFDDAALFTFKHTFARLEPGMAVPVVPAEARREIKDANCIHLLMLIEEIRAWKANESRAPYDLLRKVMRRIDPFNDLLSERNRSDLEREIESSMASGYEFSSTIASFLSTHVEAKSPKAGIAPGVLLPPIPVPKPSEEPLAPASETPPQEEPEPDDEDEDKPVEEKVLKEVGDALDDLVSRVVDGDEPLEAEKTAQRRRIKKRAKKIARRALQPSLISLMRLGGYTLPESEFVSQKELLNHLSREVVLRKAKQALDDLDAILTAYGHVPVKRPEFMSQALDQCLAEILMHLQAQLANLGEDRGFFTRLILRKMGVSPDVCSRFKGPDLPPVSDRAPLEVLSARLGLASIPTSLRGLSREVLEQIKSHTKVNLLGNNVNFISTQELGKKVGELYRRFAQRIPGNRTLKDTEEVIDAVQADFDLRLAELVIFSDKDRTLDEDDRMALDSLQRAFNLEGCGSFEAFVHAFKRIQMEQHAIGVRVAVEDVQRSFAEVVDAHAYYPLTESQWIQFAMKHASAAEATREDAVEWAITQAEMLQTQIDAEELHLANLELELERSEALMQRLEPVFRESRSAIFMHHAATRKDEFTERASLTHSF